MKNTTKIIAFSWMLLLSNVSHASAEQAIASAEEARQAAASVGYEWRDTGKLIKQARSLAAKGNKEEAIAIARKAEEQGKDAMAQYRREASRYSSNH